MADSPTIVLVHGALTDASVWSGVIEELHREGHTVLAPAMPLRSLRDDVDYLTAFLDTIEGPVILAGHSYGGSVISHPEIADRDVAGLVFVSAFAPAADESTGELNGRWPGSRLGERTVLVRPRPDGNDMYLQPAHFADVYAGDLPAPTVALMAATQRPIDPAALEESFEGRPAWETIPAWAVASTEDHSLPIEAQRAMARRAGASVVEVTASHASPVSHPAAVAGQILAAARSAVAI